MDDCDSKLASATHHSIDRAKERCHLKNQRAAERQIEKALKNGRRAEDFSSWERNYLLGEARDDCIAIAYNKFCYIVNSKNACVTLYPLPVWFGKKKRFDGKERIRDYKKYQINYGHQDDTRGVVGIWEGVIEFDEFDNKLDIQGEEVRKQAEKITANTLLHVKEGGDLMSRDWTPFEHYLVEQHNIKNGQGDYWDFLASLRGAIAGKEPVRLHLDEEITVRKEFPVLGKFLEPFMKLYERVSKYENGIEFLKLQDLELQEYISTGNHNPNSYLMRWFKGELVDNFHYRERNDALLIECVCEEAMLHAGKQYDAYMDYRLNWYAEHGISEGLIANFKKEYLDDVKEGRFQGTFHQYEMEFGYHDGELFYDSFDVFLDRYSVEKPLEDVLYEAAQRSCDASRCDAETWGLGLVDKDCIHE